MKRYLISAISVLALTAVSGPLSAADSDVPAASERSARQERAPARERAPSSARQTAPRQQAAQQAQPRGQQAASSSSSSTGSGFTGSQAGGTGGGNAGAGNFVDPGANQFFRSLTCCGSVPNAETPFSFGNRRGSFTYGGFIGHNIQIGQYVWGVEADVSGTTKSESSAALGTYVSVVYPGSSFETATRTATRTESFTGQVSQNVDSSLRLRYGYLVTPYILAYITGGLAVSNVSGSFSYTAVTNYNGFTGPFTDTTYGASSWSQTRAGGTVGAGVEGVVALGVKARFEYRYSDFGTIGTDIPLARTCSGFCPGPNFGSTNAHIDQRVAFHTFRVGLGVGF